MVMPSGGRVIKEIEVSRNAERIALLFAFSLLLAMTVGDVI